VLALALSGALIQSAAFQPAVAHPAGGEPIDLVVADVAGGPALDVVTANAASADLSLLVGDGVGGFAPATALAVPGGAAPAALAAGDLFGSARLAVACAPTAELLLLDGAGALVAAVPAAPGLAFPADVAVGDLDGAGERDVVIACAGDLLLGGGGLAVVLDDGVAPLVAALLPAPPDGFQRLRRVALGDLDGDGDLDVAATRVPGLFGGPAHAGILLYANDGAGGFSHAGAIATGEPPYGLCAGDLDADGNDDLAVALDAAPGGGTSAVVAYLHDGSALLAPASFAAAAPSAAGAFAVDLACADLGDDGLAGFLVDLDVVAANFGSADLGVHDTFEPGPAAFAATDAVPAGLAPAALAVGDLDGDRTPDVVIADRGGDAVQVLLGVPFALAQTFGAGCAGTGGLVPAISAVGLPSYGEPAFGVRLEDARPLAPALLGVSGAQLTTPLLGGCAIYLATPVPVLAAATDAAGDALVELAIPADAAPFSGLNVFFQYLVFDPFGTFLGAYALSDGLRIKLGDLPSGS
jgi:hypothetical protein